MALKSNLIVRITCLIFIFLTFSGFIDANKNEFDNQTYFQIMEGNKLIADSSNVSPLKGKHINMSILGISDWRPSSIVGEMCPEFSKYAKDKYGYDVEFAYQEAPFGESYHKAANSLASRSQEFNIIISDSQWLGTFAEPGWIVHLNEIIENNPELSNIAWYDEVVKSGYMTYPDESNDLWGLPQEGDIILLYVRKDMLQDPVERKNFLQKYGFDLPQEYDDFIDLDIDKFEKIAEFFTRPEKGLYGTALEYSKDYDYMSGYLYPFIWSTGGEIWDAGSGKIFGVLNTESNAKALERMVKLLKYNPPGANNFGITDVVDAFAKGKVFSAFQWAAMGQTIIPPELKDKVMVVPPPCFKINNEKKRIYSLGGQSWVINKFNSPEQTQVAIDFLKWWYLPETQMEFARRGGNPTTKEVMNSPEFESMQSWYKAYKFMFTQKNARDFWHDPKYSEMLDVQQAALADYVSGVSTDAKKVLDYIAYQQQKTLYDAGRTDIAPPNININIKNNTKK